MRFIRVRYSPIERETPRPPGANDEDRNTGVADNETDGACIEVGGHRTDAGAR